MDLRDSILDCIGHTPMVRLSRYSKGLSCPLVAKLDELNPGGSVKDRIGIAMIRDAEARGLIKPGGTITEGTAGNTGVGLALAANVLGYKTVFCLPDKMSKEKVDLLRAYGAKVIVTPTAVPKEDPKHYTQVAMRIARETPNAWYAGQFANAANPKVHYDITGPEIWKQTDGKITHFFAGAGTGGTINGIGRYLKEMNPKIKIILCDPAGSFYSIYFRDRKAVAPARGYTVEGVGLDYIAKTMDFANIDDAIEVTDKEAYAAARKLTRLEAIFTGGSTGMCLAGATKWVKQNNLAADQLPVVFFCDIGDRYLSKMYNDDWMRDNGMLDEADMTAGEVLSSHGRKPQLVTTTPEARISDVMKQVKSMDLSQIPVIEGGKPVGALYDDQLLELLLKGRKLADISVREVMGEPLPQVDEDTPASELLKLFESGKRAVLIRRASGDLAIVTKTDLLAAL
ncbi:MAG: pyridoxal-phosphate dependent enzyme [Planctomycetes bacterium]|nr:pyridoxal-phosphate dependent enzyme [Planctomycetota bacterium]